MYVGLQKERHIHLDKCVGTRSYSSIGISKFVYSVYSLSGSFPITRALI
jgi:hypothetical protein